MLFRSEIVTLVASAFDVGPSLSELSVTDSARSRKTTVPSEEHVTVTVIDVPDDDEVENAQPVAVPVEFEKSPEVSPEIDSENVSV